MAFYIIEKQEQLNNLSNLGDCFIHFIGGNDNYHPKLTNLSLIYLHSLNNDKGYILSINHTESFSLNIDSINSFLHNETNKLFCINKKDTMYFYNNFNKLFDINFIQNIKDITYTESCYNYYYNNYFNIYNVNNLIPISKHYEKYNFIFNKVKDIILLYNENNSIYKFNNTEHIEAFFHIENNGIKLDKNKYISFFGNKTKYHEFNIKEGNIYPKYNLYTKTSRPSNSFNNINLAALNKDNNERETFICNNDYLYEFDYSAFHPHLAAKLCNIEIPNNQDIYDWLNMSKQDVFHNLYGSIEEKYLEHPYFSKINKWISFTWQINKYGLATKNRYFNWEKDQIENGNKMLSYLLQSYETYYSVLTINKISKYLNNKKSKLILTTYDSFLIDYSLEDGDIKQDIKTIMEFPSKLKIGTNYNNLVGQSF